MQLKLFDEEIVCSKVLLRKWHFKIYIKNLNSNFHITVELFPITN